jgi:inorganic pyrophosphatase
MLGIDRNFQVVSETSKGSRNKSNFDPEQRIFALKKVLWAGMTFPYDFRFIPSTMRDSKALKGRTFECGYGFGGGSFFGLA